SESKTVSLWLGMSPAEIVKTNITKHKDFAEIAPGGYKEGHWEIARSRCFLELAWVTKGPDGSTFSASEHVAGIWEGTIPDVIHLPGLRGNPERTYQATAAGPRYPGTFEKY